jgi:hypothetical protein
VRNRTDKHTIKAGVVRLNVSLGHFAVLDNKGVALAAGVAKDGSTIEGQIKGAGKLAVRVGKEADARFASRVQGGAPSAHAGSVLAVRWHSGHVNCWWLGQA